MSFSLIVYVYYGGNYMWYSGSLWIGGIHKGLIKNYSWVSGFIVGIFYCNETEYSNAFLICGWLIWTLRNNLFCNQYVKKKGCWADKIDVFTSNHTKTQALSSKVTSSNAHPGLSSALRLLNWTSGAKSWNHHPKELLASTCSWSLTWVSLF